MMQALRLKSILVPSLSQSYHYGPSKSLISWIAAYTTSAQYKANPTNEENSILADYLVSSFRFSKDRALSVSSKYSHHKTLEKPEQVVHFFKGLGFSDAHIRSIAHALPRLLFANVEKTLKPKVKFFQDIGLSGPPLGSLLSRTPILLHCSVDRCLKPTISLIRQIFVSDGRKRSIESVNDDLFRTLTRYGRIILVNRTLEANIHYLESCGIVGAQLSSLLLRLPCIFSLPQDKLAEIVSRALDMNFTKGSKMLVHGIYSLSCMTIKTLDGKFEVLKVFGFSKEEVESLFRKSPYIFGLSAATLRHKLELLLNYLKLNRLMVVRTPWILTLKIEERVIPRYKVLEMIKLKGLLKKEPSLSTSMSMPESKFLKSYVERFEADAEELLLAYNGQYLPFKKNKGQYLMTSTVIAD